MYDMIYHTSFLSTDYEPYMSNLDDKITLPFLYLLLNNKYMALPYMVGRTLLVLFPSNSVGQRI